MKTFFMQAARFQCYHNHLKTLCFFQKRALTRSGTNGHYLLDSCHVTVWSRYHMTYWLESSHSSYQPAKFVGLHFVKVKMKYFDFVTWPLDRCVTWLCGWGLFILSYHPVKFGIHRPCESGNITPLICQVTTELMCHVTLWVGSSYPKSLTY